MKLRKTMLLALGVMVAMAAVAQKPQEYKLSVGTKFTISVSMDQTIEQDLMGQKQTILQNITNVDSYEVMSKEDGNYRLKITGVRQKVKMDNPMMNIDMDSDLDGEENLALKATVGKSYFVIMDKYGSLLKVEGFDDYKQEIKAGLVGTSLEEGSSDILAALQESTVEATFQNFFNIYSADGKKKWSTEYDLVVNTFPLKVTTDFERVSADKLAASGSMSLSGDVEVQGMAMTAELEGIQTTNYELDKKTGLSKTINSEQDLSGTLEVQGMSIPMSIKTISKTSITW